MFNQHKPLYNESMNEEQQLQKAENKSQIYLAGSFIGLAVGFLAAYFYNRAAEESDNEDGLQATDFLKIALTLLGVVRQLTEIGSRGSDKK